MVAEPGVQDRETGRGTGVDRVAAGGEALLGAEVGREDARGDAVGALRPLPQLAQPVLAAGDQQEGVAAGGEALGVGPASAMRATASTRSPRP